MLFGCDEKNGSYFEDGTRDINGTQLYYKILGNGEPIVVLHGGPGLNHTYFLPQMAQLAQDYRLIFFDQRLSGLSSGDVDSTAISMQHFVEDVEGIRKTFQLGKMNLMAHSWGGVLAMWYAIEYPENLRSVILVNTNAASSELALQAQRILGKRFTREDSLKRAQIMQSQAFKNQEPQAFAELFRVNFRTVFYNRALADSLTLKLQPNFAANSSKLQYLLKDLANYDLQAELAKITCPTLLVHGDHDATPLDAIKKIHKHIHDSRLLVLKNCGHFPFIEIPEMFFNHVKTFIDET